MKFICDTADFKIAARNVQKAIPSKSVNPALSGIYIKSTDAGLELCGYDTEIGITTIIPAGIPEPGSVITNDAISFCNIISHLPAEQAQIEVDEKFHISITSGDASFTLSGQDPKNYPEIPYVSGGEPIVLPKGILKEMIQQVSFAVSTDETKTVHRGVKFQISAGCLELIALDGFRLAVRKEPIEYNGKSLFFIVPKRTVDEICRIVDDNEGYISINLGQKHIVFGADGYQIVSTRYEGDFIDYHLVTPKTHDTTLIVSTQKIRECIDRMSLMISEKFRSPIRCYFENDSIRFTVKTVNGNASDKMSAKMEGKKVARGFNNKYLSQAFAAIESDQAKILTGVNRNHPVCITPLEGDSFFYMVLPVQMPEDEIEKNDEQEN